MISALDEIESVIRCVELGAEDYLAKPFNPTLLRARVGASLEKKRLRDAVRASLERLEHELDAARALQLGMLPGTFPSWSAQQPVEVYALMDPAKEVGGDLYDFFDAGGGVFCFLVGDVSGKGAPAAMFMARTRSLVRMAVELWGRLGAERASPAGIAEVGEPRAVPEQSRPDVRHRVPGLPRHEDRGDRLRERRPSRAAHPPRLRRGRADSGRPEAPLAVRLGSSYQNRTLTLQPGKRCSSAPTA